MYSKDEIAREMQGVLSEVEFRASIDETIIALLDRLGIYYRCFSRIKSPESLCHKLNVKEYSDHHRIQDIYGIRVVLYYQDDIEIIVKQLQSKFNCIELVKDTNKEDVFRPERLNMVCKYSEDLSDALNLSFFDKYHIDTTFEIQIRTVFSEGWHEIEHDMRYKCENSWKNYSESSRALNGIFATLNTCDWAITHLFDNLAYLNYKNSEWEDLLRNKFRIKLRNSEISSAVRSYLENNNELGKAIYRYDRKKLIDRFYNSKINIPITCDNIIKIINGDLKIDEDLLSMTDDILINIC